MSRPRFCLCRNIRQEPNSFYHKPQGIPLRHLEAVEITAEELEAVRLKNLEGLEQEKIAIKLKTSQSTVQRVLAAAHQKIADALVNGKAIKIIRHE